MIISCYFDFLKPDEFAFGPRLGRSKKREEELKLVREHGQTRRVLISPYGEVLFSDLPLYEALIAAEYSSIAVVVVVGQAEPWDIKAAKAFSAQHPLRWFGGSKAQQARRRLKAISDKTTLSNNGKIHQRSCGGE